MLSSYDKNYDETSCDLQTIIEVMHATTENNYLLESMRLFKHVHTYVCN